MKVVNVEQYPFDWGDTTRRFMNPGELEALLTLVARVQPKRMIEFGVNDGRTAKVILETFPYIETYIGVDVLPGYQTACNVQRKEVPQQPGHLAAHLVPRFQLRVSKNGSFDLTSDDLPELDFAFIDGDHGWRGVLNDTFLAFDKITKGRIVWHDYHHKGTVDVGPVLDTFAKHMDIKQVAGTWFAYLDA